MKTITAIGLCFLIFSTTCCKETKKIAIEKPISCNFGFAANEFNKARRVLSADEALKARKPIISAKKPPAVKPCIYLDFDGHNVSGTAWNVNGDFYCNYAGLTAAEQLTVLNGVAYDYRNYNVVVTADSNVYNAAPQFKRIRVVLTEDWQWYCGQNPCASGVSYLNSFTWGNNTPCFVFTTLINYDLRRIMETASHEVGHTLGLYHQSLYDSSCNKTNEYNTGSGDWAPIMGNSQFKPIGLWITGQTSVCCTCMQTDSLIIISKL